MRAVLLACLFWAGIQAQPSKPSTGQRDQECFRPLAEFCERDRCPTYRAQVDALRAFCAGTVGRCGSVRITHYGDGLTTQTRFFDKAGKLTAVRVGNDLTTDNTTCPDWTHYGAVPNCRLTNIKQICRP